VLRLEFCFGNVVVVFLGRGGIRKLRCLNMKAYSGGL